MGITPPLVPVGGRSFPGWQGGGDSINSFPFLAYLHGKQRVNSGAGRSRAGRGGGGGGGGGGVGADGGHRVNKVN